MIKYRIYTEIGFEEYKEIPLTSNSKIEEIDYSIEVDEEGNNYVKINSITKLKKEADENT
jgi:hypothetical protein